MNIVKVFKTFSYLNVFILPTWIITPLLATETTVFFLIYEGNYSNLFDLTPGNGNGQSLLIFYPMVLYSMPIYFHFQYLRSNNKLYVSMLFDFWVIILVLRILSIISKGFVWDFYMQFALPVEIIFPFIFLYFKREFSKFD